METCESTNNIGGPIEKENGSKIIILKMRNNKQ